MPVIVDQNKDGKWVNDSWEIAKYLEKTYPDQPSLFKGTSGEPPGSEHGCHSLPAISSTCLQIGILQTCLLQRCSALGQNKRAWCKLSNANEK